MMMMMTLSNRRLLIRMRHNPSTTCASMLLLLLLLTVSNVRSYNVIPATNQQPLSSSSSITRGKNVGIRHHCKNNNPYRGGAISKTILSRRQNVAIAATSDSTAAASEAAAPSTSLSSITASLIKSMLGTGVLALPGALAVASNYKSSLVPANILLATLGLLSAYTFVLYGHLVDSTQALTLGELWNNIYNDGNTSTGTNKSAIIVSIASFLFTFGVAVAYSLIIGDIFTGFISQFTGGATSLAVFSLRQWCILGITLSTLLPLCNLESMASLAPFSILGTIGSLLTTAFIVWRSPLVSGVSSPYVAAATKPLAFGTYNRMLNGSPSPLVLVATGCVSLAAHFGACDFYHTIKKATASSGATTTAGTTSNPIIQNFKKVTIGGFTAVAVVNAITMIAGFLTFGSNSLGIVLNNYSPTDIYATISKLLVGVSVVGAYPIVTNACKSELLTMLGTTKPTRAKQVQTTTTLLGIVTAIALSLQDAGFVISFVGAVMGSNIIYTFPSLLFLRRGNGTKLERNFCRFLVGFGIFSALIGGITSVINSFFPHLLG